MSHNVKITSYVITNTGLVRQNNEDNFYINGRYLKEEERENSLQLAIEENKRDHLLAVCDGMGGESQGEFASITVVKSLQELENSLFRNGINTITDMSDCIKEFVISTNDKLCKHMKEHGKSRMGTTLAGLYIKENKAIAFHLGDSRIYMYRAGVLKQITEDHTEAQRLVRLGIINKEQANHHQNRHQLTRHFGILPEEGLIEPDISEEFEIIKGDIFLFCSDGLTDMVSDSRIESIIDKYKDSDELHTRLIGEALANGGQDNVTAIAVRIDGIEQISDLLRKKRSNKPNKIFKIATGILVVVALYIAFLLCKDIYIALVDNGKDNTNSISTSQQTNVSDEVSDNESDNAISDDINNDEDSSLEVTDNSTEEDNSIGQTDTTSQIEDKNNEPLEEATETTEEKIVVVPDKYTIKRGENLYQISRKFYGNNNAVKPIMQLNKIEDINKVFAGQSIKLPSIEYVNNYKEPEKSSNVENTSETVPTATDIPEQYIIKAGDNLFQISKRFYGNGSMVNPIVELNGLENAENIKVGQVITLPK